MRTHTWKKEKFQFGRTKIISNISLEFRAYCTRNCQRYFLLLYIITILLRNSVILLRQTDVFLSRSSSRSTRRSTEARPYNIRKLKDFGAIVDSFRRLHISGMNSMRFSLMILTEVLNWSAPERTSGASLSVDIAKLHFG